MRNLFLFLWKYNFFISFLLLEVLCGYLIVQNNNFQRASFINSTNQVAAKVNSAVSSVTEYINLGNTNDALSRENAAFKSLMPDVFYIDSAIRRVQTDTVYKQQYTFMTAKVVNNTTNRRSNYLTLNRGSLQGVEPEMGVICPDGIVGVVKDVSEHFCSVMSFLHKDAKVSAQFKKNNFYGSLVWDGFDATHGKLNDIEKHVKVAKGDTIITTSFSFFPEGIMVGVVESVNESSNSTFQDITVRLSTKFNSLTYVYLIGDKLKEEKQVLEEPLKNDR